MLGGHGDTTAPVPARDEPAGSVRGGTQSARVGIALAALVALLAAGCGARWSEAQKRAVLARYAPQAGPTGPDGAVAAPASAGGSAAGPGTTVAGGDAPGATPVGGSVSPRAGARQQAAGPGDTGSRGQRPCAAPTDAPGVSDGEIVIGSIASLSGPVPGLGASALAATRAYVAYRNASGGVCGRRLVLRTADDGTDNGRYRSIVGQMADQVLGIAGGFAAGDAGGADVVEARKLPVVTVAVSAAFERASTVFDINPPFEDVNKPVAKYNFLFSQGVRTAALVYIAADQVRSEVQGKQKPQMIASGIRVVHENEVPLSTLSFDSAARGAANSGADYMLFVGDPGQSASMAKSMRDARYRPKFEEYLTAYASKYTDVAGTAAEGTTSWTRTEPVEDQEPSAELAAFLRWMRQVAPGEPTDTLAADAWVGIKAFVDALEALPGPIGRDALLAQLRATHDYDAGGMLGPIDLGAKRNRGCSVAMKVVSGRWARLTPPKGFLC